MPDAMSAIETPTFAGCVVAARDRHDARLRLHEHVVRLLVAHRAVGPVARDAAPDRRADCAPTPRRSRSPSRSTAPGARLCTNTSAASISRAHSVAIGGRL